jgi:hypothetical protein
VRNPCIPATTLCCLLALAGCASMLPTQTVNGVAVYVRDTKTVDAYCRPRVRAENLGPRMYGCYIRAENTIMVVPDRPWGLAHELRHADGWEHHGACHSSQEHPDGLKPDGMPCDWYRR